jgi:hypothetical protein
MASSTMKWAPLKLPGNAAAIMTPVAPPGDTIGILQRPPAVLSATSKIAPPTVYRSNKRMGVAAQTARPRPKFLHRKTITAGNDWEMLKGRWFVLATFDN